MRAPAALCGRRFYYDNDSYDGKGWAMKLALAQIDMRLGDIEGIC